MTPVHALRHTLPFEHSGTWPTFNIGKNETSTSNYIGQDKQTITQKIMTGCPDRAGVGDSPTATLQDEKPKDGHTLLY